MAISFLVWEPALERIGRADVVEADTPCQAAFLAANERKIGHRSAEYAVANKDDVTIVHVEPHTTYQVHEREKPPEDSPGVA